jgi:hypothetical protein
MWTVDSDLFRLSDHFRNLEFGSPKCKPKPLVDQDTKTRKEVSCVKSRSDDLENSKLQSSGFRKS